MILSGGVYVKATLWSGNTTTWPGFNNIPGANLNDASYGELYARQPWVSILVNKLGMGEARLPLKVYEHDDLNRPDASSSPYAQLLDKPNPRQSRFMFWLWMVNTFDVYGESFAIKIRDRGGRPTSLIPLHPSSMHEEEEDNGEVTWTFQNGRVRVEGIRSSDLVHPKTYNPASMTRGLSRLEPLRRTLEFEDAAQRAQSSFWRQGARPGYVLTHPQTLSDAAQDRIKFDWQTVAGGADRTGATVVLEEGMKPERLSLSATEAAYIDSRKLNREEACAAYDVPPPAVHILDHATFSNITEQLRSLYRDTHAPRLKLFESCLETELRGSIQPGNNEADFGDDLYAEFLLDEVLRGDFEARADALQKADYMTLAEKRRIENLPFVEGTDRIFVNAATIPLDATSFGSVGALVRAGYDPEAALTALEIPAIAHTGLVPVTVQGEGVAEGSGPVVRSVDTLMGRLGRIKSIHAIDPEGLVTGLDIEAAQIVKTALALSQAENHSVSEFRTRLRAVAGG